MGRYTIASKKAKDLTNKQLGEELAKIGPLSDNALKDILPRKRDKEEFAKLMAVVEKETETDNQLTYLTENLQTAGVVVLKVLKHFLV